jgi:hypothetical protein
MKLACDTLTQVGMVMAMPAVTKAVMTATMREEAW